ncbi:MAG: hypothetical protein V1779_06450 [bacterium]
MQNKLILIILLILLFTGCGTVSETTRTNCINEKMKDVTLRWGGHNYKTNCLSGWQIDGELNFYSFVKDSLNLSYKTKLIGTVDTNKFCELLGTARKLFVEVQALYAPGDSSHFVEYIQSSTNTNLRAVWNMRFKTYGSTEFRDLFDSLNAMSKYEKYIYPKEGNKPGNSIK